MAAIVLAAVGAVALGLSDAPARWLVVEDPMSRADAVVVLGGDRDYERTLMAARLVREGWAPLLVLSGSETGEGDGAPSLRAVALREGVAAERIRMETGSHSTRDSIVNTQGLLREAGVSTVVLVTSPYHQRRAYLTARSVWAPMRIVNRPAEPSFWRPERWWRTSLSRRVVLSEYAKLAYYGIRGWLF